MFVFGMTCMFVSELFGDCKSRIKTLQPKENTKCEEINIFFLFQNYNLGSCRLKVEIRVKHFFLKM